MTSCLCVTFKTDQSDLSLPTVPLGSSLRFPVAAKGDTRCESVLHREPRYTAVSTPPKNSCLSQLAGRQKHCACREKPSVLFLFNTKTAIHACQICRNSRIHNYFLFGLLRWFSRATRISRFLVHMLSGSLSKYLGKSIIE